jgi:thiol-disulfide isomerase/thioredoxin
MSSTLKLEMIHLKSSNFAIKGDKLVLSHTPGPTLVVFSANSCPGCEMLMRELQQISKEMIGMQFGVMNISEGDGRLVVRKSQHTKKPITEVPTVFFYVNHIPVSKFIGDYTREHITAFVKQMFVEIGKQPFQYDQRKRMPARDSGLVEPEDTTPPSQLLDYNSVDSSGAYDRLDSAYE